ncbi:hypothetical protein BGW37DRAFT_146572 [Umbelopsis sp. PMI_123]|nr:hypothetical protein BGW37DRAFT_146572 [Umbelopsis sp. PMI_123]
MSNRVFLPYTVAIVTPFTQDGEFDTASVPELVKYYQQHTPGLLVCGSTGEQHCLSIAERKQLYNLVRETVGPDYTLYAGVAAFKTKDAIELAKAAEQASYNGIMLGFPPYRIPTQRDAEAYIRAVAAATSLPIFIYNNPPRTGFALDPKTFVTVAQSVPNVLGIKEAGKVENVNIVKPQLPQNMSYLTGSDNTYVSAIEDQGYTGITAIVAAVYPNEMKSVVDYVSKNKYAKAQDIINNEVEPGFSLMKQAGFLPSLKYILRKRGVPAGYCAHPLLDPTEEFQALLDKEFQL